MSMARLFSNRDRPFDLGPLPLEQLTRDPVAPIRDARQPKDASPANTESIAAAIPEYRALFRQYLDGEVAPARAPVPEDPVKRAQNLKASAYFLDVTLAGCCRIDALDWVAKDYPAHTHAFVFLIEFGREAGRGEAGDEWIRGTNTARTGPSAMSGPRARRARGAEAMLSSSARGCIPSLRDNASIVGASV